MRDKDELERYETSEAQDTVRLIRKLSPRTIERAPPLFRDEVMRRINRREFPRNHFTPTQRFQVSVSAVAGLIVGVILTLFFHTFYQ